MLLNFNKLEDTLTGVKTLGKQSLQHLSVQHSLVVDLEDGANTMKAAVVDHVTLGRCKASTSSLCMLIEGEYRDSDAGARSDLEMYILQLAARKTVLSKKAMQRVLKSKGIQFSADNNIGELRQYLHSYITRLHKGKQAEWSQNQCLELESEHNRHLNEIHNEWPQPASMDLKEDCFHNFCTATSSTSLCEFMCACCAESTNLSERKIQQLEGINLDLMRDCMHHIFNKNCTPLQPPFTEGLLANLMIDPAGVVHREAKNDISLQLCSWCNSALKRGKLPRLAVTNLNVLGSIPPEMKNMTMVEEMLITCCWAKCCIVKLQDNRTSTSLPSSQRGIKGNIIIYPQQVGALANMLPHQSTTSFI